MTHDAQNVNLAGMKRHQALMAKMAKISRAKSAQNPVYNVEWVTVEGVDVMQIKGSDFVAAPCTSRKNSRKFDIINITKGEYICQLNKNEVGRWLVAQEI